MTIGDFISTGIGRSKYGNDFTSGFQKVIIRQFTNAAEKGSDEK